uniref:Uncharacterized protein n=1 Tax=Daphnia galeata TaxID=27404 RepID=A0A8J2S1F4_9CRUS|nr:unnamed protein product [Daphnia galeata]
MVKTSFVALAVFVACAVHVHGASDDVEVAWENFQAHHPLTRNPNGNYKTQRKLCKDPRYDREAQKE